jgi:hypothetical protein
MHPIQFLTDAEAQPRLEMLRSYVAKPLPSTENWTDPDPGWVEGSQLWIGNKYHASNVEALQQRGITAVLNCASGGISRLPMDELHEKGIAYEFTNVRQDNPSYPILFDHETGEPSKHLQIAKSFYSQVRTEGGRVMFFCIAGQNRYVGFQQRMLSRGRLSSWTLRLLRTLQISNLGSGGTHALWIYLGRNSEKFVESQTICVGK